MTTCPQTSLSADMLVDFERESYTKIYQAAVVLNRRLTFWREFATLVQVSVILDYYSVSQNLQFVRHGVPFSRDFMLSGGRVSDGTVAYA